VDCILPGGSDDQSRPDTALTNGGSIVCITGQENRKGGCPPITFRPGRPTAGPIADNVDTVKIGANNVEFGYFSAAGSHQGGHD
jgi:hypothetical protein